jgi:hypothetical protein
MTTVLQHRYLTLSKSVDTLARGAKLLAEVAYELDEEAERTLSRIHIDLDELAEILAQKGGA